MSFEEELELISTVAHKITIDMHEANEERVRSALIEMGWLPPEDAKKLKMLIRQAATCAYKSNPELYHKLMAVGNS